MLQVFVEYEDFQGATKAKQALHNRKFGGNSVIASYYSEDKFLNGDYGGWHREIYILCRL